MRLGLLIPLSFLVTAVGFALAQTPGGKFPSVSLLNYVESYVKEVPTGGHTLVGATTGDGTPEQLLHPALLVPRALYTKGSVVCVETLSIDGSYSSHGELTGGELAANQGRLRVSPGDSRFPRGTQYEHEMLAFGGSQLATLASVGGCDSTENLSGHTYLVIDRGAEPGAAVRSYRLFVNPKWAQDVAAVYTQKDGHKARVVCLAAPTIHANTAFSRICDLTGPFAESTHVELSLSRFGRTLLQDSFDLVLSQDH
jgi:hypothetical protein